MVYSDKCKDPFEYNNCGSACPAECGVSPHIPCTKQCVLGCFCPASKPIYDSLANTCVKSRAECKHACKSDKDCGKNTGDCGYHCIENVCRKYCFDIFKAEIAELVGYFVNRGADREDYYIKPGEEPKSVPPSEADAPIADDERKSRLNFSPFSKQNQCTHALKMAFVISFSSDLCVNFSLSYLPIP